MRITSPPRTSRMLASIAVAAVAAGGAVAAPASPLVPAAEAADAPGSRVAIAPNPATAGSQFQGWGNSLVWFANATGGYPDELREELFQDVFGPEGLNLNVARYNFGGGRASDVGDYFRPGGAVDGFWAEDTSADADSLYGTATTNHGDRGLIAELWDPENPDHYDWSRDSAQQWWLEQLSGTREDLVLEGFVNSPPYFMTNNGYTSGGFTSTDEQVRTDHDVPEKYAAYIVRVAEHLEDTYGVDFQTLTPFNEPCNGYWGTTATMAADGITPQPNTASKPNLTQEGAQICPGAGEGQQQNLIKLLAQELAGADTDAVISANDETNPSQFNAAWSKYDQGTRDLVNQINVHTYWDGGAREARDHALGSENPLWMSETGGDWISGGFNPQKIEGGVNIAKKVTSDLRQLQPEAYILWQEVEDYYNMQQPKPKGENLNWGSVFVDFDCSYVDAEGTALDSAEGSIGFKSMRRVKDALAAGTDISEVEDCNIVTGSKFNALRNFTHFITPGDRIIQTDNSVSTAAVGADGSGLSLIHTNDTASDRAVTIDLSGFGEISEGATVTPYVTTEGAAVNDRSTSIVEGESVAVDVAGKSATLLVPAQSVTTFEVTGVSGVAETATGVADGSTYQIIGVQSSKALTDGGDAGLTITTAATSADAALTQTWTAHRIAQEGLIAGRQTFVLETSNGRFARFTDAGSEVAAYDSPEAAAADPAARWHPATEDGGKTWTFSNGHNGKILDVGGSSTAENAAVGWWSNSYGSNQRWTLRDVSLAPHADPVVVRTQLGTAPELPTTVVPVHVWGESAPVTVTWDMPDDSAWSRVATVEVTGSATDVYGNVVEGVKALVDVGPLTSVDPTSVTLVRGSTTDQLRSVAPTTVQAQAGTGNARFGVPVTWDFSGVDNADLAEPGTFTVPGTVAATDSGGEDVPATLHVIVVPVTTGTLDVPCDATATFTEPGYSAAATCNGDTTDKGWSNWKSGSKNPSDTLTYGLPEDTQVVSARMYLYKDGSSHSYPASVQAQYRVAGSGEWTDAGGLVTVEESTTASGPVVEIPLGNVATDGVRIVMNARPDTHMIVSEVVFSGEVPADSTVTELSRLTVNGVDVDSFSPQTHSYTVETLGSRADVVGVPLDRDARVEVTRVGNVVTVTVTAVDGTTTGTYEVTLDPRVDLGDSVAVSGTPQTGTELSAEATTDPEDASLTYQWLRDGEQIDGATSRSYTPGAQDIGGSLAVRVTASAEGYRDAEETSASVTVEDARTPTTVALSVSSSTLVLGQEITLSAATGPGDAGGRVEFLEGDTVVASAEVTSGHAQAGVEPGVGNHVYTARYLPSDVDLHLESVSDPVSVEVLDPAAASIRLSADEVEVGGVLQVVGSGFGPGESVVIALEDADPSLDRVMADGAGAFSLEVTIPVDAAIGDHRILATGEDTGLEAGADLVLVGASGGEDPGSEDPGTGDSGQDDAGLAVTGSGYLVPAALAALVLLGAGGSLFLARRRRGEGAG